mgnify:CR=1 FL=1
MTFIASTLQDNQILMKMDPGYLANLKALPTVERERLLLGNWKIKAAAGLFFRRTQVGEMLEELPKDVISWCRGWDLAATSEDEDGDPAYTAGVLIGKRGQTLDSLQYLVSLVVNKESDGYLRVKLDTENYRERRKKTLETLAKNISYKVKRTKHPVSLEPMNPYREKNHSFCASECKYVMTRSEGEDPFRHVVISLKKEVPAAAEEKSVMVPAAIIVEEEETRKTKRRRQRLLQRKKKQKRQVRKRKITV